jgi:hypothetical protein
VNGPSDLDYTVGLDGTGFVRGAGQVRNASRGMRSSVGSDFQSAKNAVIGFARGVAGPMAAASAAVAAIGGVVQRVAAQVGELAGQAKTAGVSFEAFQELKFAAEQNLVGVDALTDGLKEMQLRLDEAVTTGGGPAVEALSRLGYTAGEISEKLKDPPRLFEEIIDRVKQLDEAAQIRVLDEIFGGTAAEQFSRLMDDAEGAISRSREEARQLGVVLDEEYLQTVEEVNRQWQTMTTYVGTNLKRAVLDVARNVIFMLDKMREVEARADATIQRQIDEYTTKLDAAQSRIREITEREGVSVLPRYLQDATLTGSALASTLEVDRREMEAWRQERAALMAELQSRQVTVVPTKLPEQSENGFPGGGGGGGGGGSARKAAISDAGKLQTAVAALIADLQFEEAQLGRTALQQEIYNNLKRAGVDAESDYGQAIANATTSLAERREEMERTKAAQEAMAEAVEYGFSQIEEAVLAIVEGGEAGEKAIKKLIVQLLFAVAQAKLLGTGPLAGLFGGGGAGSLFGSVLGAASGAFVPNWTGGLYHSGGRVGGGASRVATMPSSIWADAPRYHAGTLAAGEMPAILRRGEVVDPGDGSVFERAFGRGERFEFKPVIHFTGTSAEMEQLKSVIADMEQNFVAKVAEAIPEARRFGAI